MDAAGCVFALIEANNGAPTACRSISGNRIKYIPCCALQKSPGLALLELKGNPLAGVHPHAFSFLPKLRKL